MKSSLWRVWLDGSAANNTDRTGGYGFVIEHDDSVLAEGAGYFPDTTSSRMEMQAAIEGLRCAQEMGLTKLEIRSDSSYLVNCLRQAWHVKWLQNNWKGSTGKPVLNQDLWEQILLFNQEMDIIWIHVKGHIGTEFNERCDTLAGMARKNKKKMRIVY